MLKPTCWLLAGLLLSPLAACKRVTLVRRIGEGTGAGGCAHSPADNAIWRRNARRAC